MLRIFIFVLLVSFAAYSEPPEQLVERLKESNPGFDFRYFPKTNALGVITPSGKAYYLYLQENGTVGDGERSNAVSELTGEKSAKIEIVLSKIEVKLPLLESKTEPNSSEKVGTTTTESQKNPEKSTAKSDSDAERILKSTINIISPYDILGLKKGVTKEEVEKAFKRLVLKFHPDRLDDSIRSKYSPGEIIQIMTRIVEARNHIAEGKKESPVEIPWKELHTGEFRRPLLGRIKWEVMEFPNGVILITSQDEDFNFKLFTNDANKLQEIAKAHSQFGKLMEFYWRNRQWFVETPIAISQKNGKKEFDFSDGDIEPGTHKVKPNTVYRKYRFSISDDHTSGEITEKNIWDAAPITDVFESIRHSQNKTQSEDTDSVAGSIRALSDACKKLH